MKNTTQYLTLGINNELLAIHVDHVQEILELRKISRLPRSPAHLLGMIDMRGQGVPVVDLRLKLGFCGGDEGIDTENTRIIVLEVPFASRVLTFGLKTDKVFEVTSLDGEGLEPSPEIGAKWNCELIDGIGRRNGDFVTVLNLKYLFEANEIELIASRAEATEQVA